MSYTVRGSENYAAYTIKVEERHLITLEGLDNLKGLVVQGALALVPNATQVGDTLIVFPAETQLSHKLLSANNLYRDATLNSDPTATKGYVEKNRRVRALKLRGHVSTALALPVSALQYLTNKQPEPGTYFDHFKDEQISKKYIIREPKPNTSQAPAKKWVDPKQFPEHFDTAQLLRNLDKLDQNKPVWVTQKLHGTSVRYGNVLVDRELTWFERLLKRLGVEVQAQEYRFIVGSRKVVKTDPPKSTDHFYGEDVWTRYGKNLEGLIPEGFMVYGELVGWVDEATPIQKNYTYDQARGKMDFWVYRVSQINHQGIQTDLSFDQVQEFCAVRNIKTVPVLNWLPEPLEDTEWGEYLDKDYYNTLEALPHMPFEQAPVRLSNKGTVDEGICIRQDGLTPLVLKLKSPKFLLHETSLLDEEAEDLEESQNV